MSNDIYQNKKMIACLLTATKIIFLFAILFAVGLNTSYAQDTWTKKADFPGGSIDAVGFSIGSKGYIGNEFFEYDPVLNAWTQKAVFGGVPRSEAVGFSIGSKGYIGTGWTGSAFIKDFWEYDPVSDAWTQKADFGGEARGYAVGFSIDGKGYIGTGFGGSARNDFWEYNPATNAWTQKKDFGGEGRIRAVGFSIDGKGYIGTGQNNKGHYYKDFWEYDPTTDEWTQKKDFGGEAREEAAGFSIDGKGYIGTGAVPGINYTDFWEYDPVTDTWVQKADFGGGPRYLAVGFSIGNKGYIGTGVFGPQDFWEYTPDNGCSSPSNLRAPKISDTSAVLKWDATGANTLHMWLRYRAVGDTAWTKKRKNPATTDIHLNGLKSNTTYQWQMKNLCAEDTSGWVKGPDFTTAASSLNPGIKATAYPNPAKNTVTINYSATKNGKYIFEITNASGTVVLRKEANVIPGSNRITLDINRFFKGVYFINIVKPDMTRERIQLSKE